jgi:hypothetical protein
MSLLPYYSGSGAVRAAFHRVGRSRGVQGSQEPLPGQEEWGMAENQPKKVGIYERSVARASESPATVVGIIVLLIVLVVLAIILF